MSDAEIASREVPFRGGGFEPRQRSWYAVISIALIVLAWQGGTALGLIDPVFLPGPSSILAALWKLLASGVLWGHLWASLVRLSTGWILGAFAGTAIGFAIGLYSLTRSIGVPLVAAMITIPKVALLPLFIVWFGIGEWSKIFIIAFGVFFPTVISTYGAVDNVPRNLIRMAQSFGVNSSGIIRKIVFPAALPGILSGCRVSVSIGIILLVTAEMIGSDKGIGAFILASGNLYQVDQLLAGVAILSLLGICLSTVISRIEARFLGWR